MGWNIVSLINNLSDKSLSIYFLVLLDYESYEFTPIILVVYSITWEKKNEKSRGTLSYSTSEVIIF